MSFFCISTKNLLFLIFLNNKMLTLLPPEMISLIANYLSLEELLVASSVSKEWRQLLIVNKKIKLRVDCNNNSVERNKMMDARRLYFFELRLITTFR